MICYSCRYFCLNKVYTSSNYAMVSECTNLTRRRDLTGISEMCCNVKHLIVYDVKECAYKIEKVD